MLKSRRVGRTKLRYVFTIENASLSCGPALLQPAIPGVQPTVALVWKSGRKTAYGATVRALTPSSDGAAEWPAPVSLTCSVYSTTVQGHQKFEPRASQILLRVEGAVDAKRKLTATLDLAQHASYQRQTHQVDVALAQGAGTLHLTISSTWLKRSLNDDDSDGSSSISSSSTASSATGYGFGDFMSERQEEMSERRESAGSVLDAALTATSSPIPTGEGGLTGLTASAIAAAQARCGAGGGALSGGGVGHTGMGGGGRALRGVVRAPSFGLKLRRGVGPGIRTAPSETVQGRASYPSVGRVDSPTLSAGAPCLPHHTEGDAGRPPGVLADEAVPPWLRSEPQPEDLPLTPDGRLGAARQAALPVTPDSPGQPASAKQGEPRAAARAGSLSSSKGAVAAAPDGPESLFKVSSAEMTEVLRTELPLDINSLEQSILGMDCEDSRFGKLLCSRLGYTQVSAGRWEGSEATGLSREVSLVVKCPPKPMLPDATRVLIRHRLQRRDGATLLLEREVATLDMPYGESFRVQERWVAVASGVAVAAGGADPSAAEMPPAVQLRVLTHVWFKGRVALVASKIRHHSTKKSRKVAALACELLMQADLEEAAAVAHGLFGARCGQPPPACEQVAVSAAAGGDGGGEWGDSVGPTDAALVELRERYDALFEEASYFKRRCAQLEMENARLEAAARHTRKDKTELADSIITLEAQLVKERYERAVMEEVLTTAYTTTIREILESPPPAEPQMLKSFATLGHVQCASPPGCGAAGSSRLQNYTLTRSSGT